MIKHNVRWGLWGVTGGVLAFFVLAIGFFIQAEKPERISCHADVHEYIGDGQMVMSVNFDLNAGKGIISVNGRLNRPGVPDIPYSVKKYVSYEYHVGLVTLSKTTAPLFITRQTDINVLDGYLPAFFLDNTTPSYSLRFSRVEGQTGAWSVSSGRTPYFICADN